MADNLWLQGVALTLPQLSAEFGVSETEVRYTTLALFLGLCIGASFWGTASDIIGRRLAFNFTLFLAGVFGLASGGGPNWIGTLHCNSCCDAFLITSRHVCVIRLYRSRCWR
jgi:MFS family permease